MFESLAIGALAGIAYLAGLALVAGELRRRADIRACDRILARMEEQRAHREYMARPQCPDCGARRGDVCWPHGAGCPSALVLR